MVLSNKSDAYRVQFSNGFKKNVLGVLGERELSSITTKDVVQLIDGITSNSVANRVLSGLVSFLGWACGRGEIDFNVAVGVPRRKEVSREVLIDVAELNAVCNGVGGEVSDILKLMLLTGLRHGSIRMLTGVNMAGDSLVIDKKLIKNRRDLVVPMLPEAKTIMMKYVDGFSITGVKLAQQIKRTGVKWTAHDIRHLIGTNLGQIKTDSTMISRVLGHSVTGANEIYNHHHHCEEKRIVLMKLRDRFIESGMIF